MGDDRNFYKNIQPFQDFSLIVEKDHFFDVPETWYVVITDVRGSTQAIRAGRYKEVNLIGAATISCIMNIEGGDEIPFIFGGDGATLLVPRELLAPLNLQLARLQAMAKRDFELELRVGYVAVAELRKQGADMSVGKYALSPGNYTAQMKGGALTVAETMIKKGLPKGAELLSSEGVDLAPSLDGLSCRLNPIANRNGVILSLLVKPLGVGGQNDKVLRGLLADLKMILKGDFTAVRPVSLEQLKWSWPPASLRSEVLMQKKGKATVVQWVLTGLRSLISAMSLSFDIPLGPFKPRAYKSELLANSDFKKFDETLRMVIDCSNEQAAHIEEKFKELRGKGEIVFGLFRSKEALMTCVVSSASQNKHIHFIDGAEGGYALAAAQLKAQE